MEIISDMKMEGIDKKRKIGLEQDAEMESDSTPLFDLSEDLWMKVIEFQKAHEDHKTVLNLSLCNRKLFYLTKQLIEKDYSLQVFIRSEESLENYKNLTRNYKSFKIYCLGEDNESEFKELLAKFGEHAEKIEFVSGTMNVAKFCEAIQPLTSLKSLVLRNFLFEGVIGDLRIQSLEELTLDNFMNPPIDLFANCKNLQELAFGSYFDKEYEGMSLETFISQQQSLERLAFYENLRFSYDIGKKIRFQLKNLTYSFVVHKHWLPNLLFLDTQRNIEILYVEAKNFRESVDIEVNLEEHLKFIFNLTKLRILYFDHLGCEQIKIRPYILTKAKENLNLTTLVMQNDVDGTVGKIFNVFLKTSPNIDLLSFRFTDKLPAHGFTNINKLQNLTKLYINRCGNAEFKLSKLVIGDKLKDFLYAGKDLKLNEFKKFFKNHPKLAHLTLYIPKLKNNFNEFAYNLLILTELRTLTLYVEDFPDYLKDLIQTNLKYLYSFSVQEPEIDPLEEDSEIEIEDDATDDEEQ